MMNRRDFLKLLPGGIPFLSPRRNALLQGVALPIWGTTDNRYPGTTQGLLDAMSAERLAGGAVYMGNVNIALPQNLTVDVPVVGMPGAPTATISSPQFNVSGRGALHNLKATAASWAGFILNAPQNHVLSNVELTNSVSTVVYMLGNANAFIDRLTIRNAGHDSFDWSEITGASSLTIDHLLLDGAAQHGFNLLSPNGFDPSLIKVRGTDWRVKNISKVLQNLACAPRNCDFAVSQLYFENCGYGLNLVRCPGARATVKAKNCTVGMVVEDYGDHEVDRCGHIDLYTEDCPQAMEISQAGQGYHIDLHTLRGGIGINVRMAYKGFRLRQTSLYPSGVACTISSGADSDFDITVVGGGSDAVVIESQYGVLPYRHRVVTNVRDTGGYAVDERQGQDNFIEGGRQSGGGLGYRLQPSNHARIPNMVV